MSSDFDINLAMFPLLLNRPVSDYVNPKVAVEGTRGRFAAIKQFGSNQSEGCHATSSQMTEIGTSSSMSGDRKRKVKERNPVDCEGLKPSHPSSAILRPKHLKTYGFSGY